MKKYSIEMVHANYGKGKVDFDGDLIGCNSPRIQLFKQKGVVCVCCGIEGQYYRKVANYIKKNIPSGTYHINLYAVKDGKEILMTKDHIFPKSKGGRNHIDNYQTMCHVCNEEKSDKI